MAIQETRIFNADVGQESVGNAGPDAIEQDLDNLYRNKAWEEDVLLKTNTIPYTPTLDYHPMTKKFMETYVTENYMKKITYDTTGNGVVDNAEKVNNHTVESDVPSGALFTDTVYTHPDTHNASMIVQSINAQIGTTYTVVIDDTGKIVTLNNASPITVTLPRDSDLAFGIGKKIDFIVLGLGMATFQAGTGATVHSAETLVSKGQYAFITAIKIASNTWLLKGDLAETI